MAKAESDLPMLPVRDGEEPWTEEEIAEVRTELEEEVQRMLEAFQTAQAELEGLMSAGTDGTGRDPADVGSSNFERDQGLALAQNARQMYDQARLALSLLDQGKYGCCENCGEPIGKLRLQAFLRATMCVTCKQRQERR